MRRFHYALGVVGLLLTTLLAGPVAAANGDDQPPAWQGMPAGDNVMRGRFTQEKHLAELDGALVSKGRLVVVRGRGLIWQVEQPVSTRLVITREALTERTDGRETSRIMVAEQPGLAVVAALLPALFEGDMNRLQQFFDIEDRETENGRTTITLSPATAGVGEFVKQVKIEGTDRIERLRIDRPGGDYSVINLESATLSRDGLSADEKDAFAR